MIFCGCSTDTDTEASTVLNETIEVTDEAGNVSFTRNVMVLAYVNYTVRVQAFTVAGGGESSDYVILSPQAGSYTLPPPNF